MSRTLWPAVVMLRRFAADHLAPDYDKLHKLSTNVLNDGTQLARYTTLKKTLPVVKRLLQEEGYTRNGNKWTKETQFGTETHTLRTTTAEHEIKITGHELIQAVKIQEHPKFHSTTFYLKPEITPDFKALAKKLQKHGYEMQTSDGSSFLNILQNGNKIAYFDIFDRQPLLRIEHAQHVEPLIRILFPPNFEHVARHPPKQTKAQRTLH